MHCSALATIVSLTVVDGVDSRTVLPKEKHAAEEEAPLQLPLCGDGLERCPKAITDAVRLLFESGIQKGDFFHDVDIVGCQTTDPAEVVESLLTTALAE